LYVEENAFLTFRVITAVGLAYKQPNLLIYRHYLQY